MAIRVPRVQGLQPVQNAMLDFRGLHAGLDARDRVAHQNALLEQRQAEQEAIAQRHAASQGMAQRRLALAEAAAKRPSYQIGAGGAIIETRPGEVPTLAGRIPPAPLTPIQEAEQRGKLRSLQMRNQLLGSLSGPGGAQPAPAGGDPNLRLQSAPMGPEGDPNLVRTSSGGQAPAAAAQQPQTPLGHLSDQQLLGMTLDPQLKGAAQMEMKLREEAREQRREQSQWGKKSSNELQTNIQNTEAAFARLQGIDDTFKKSYLTFQDKAKTEWATFLDKWNLATPAQQADIKKRAVFFRRSYDALNRTVKELTGAAMTNAEAERIMKSMPNPGKGTFDLSGDSPAQFQAKLNDAMQELGKLRMRYNIMLRGGPGMSAIDPQVLAKSLKEGRAPISIDRALELYTARGNQIESQLRQANPQASPSALRGQVRQRLKQEYGV